MRGQVWVDIDRFETTGSTGRSLHPEPEFHRETRWRMASSLNKLLEGIHPTEETIHGPRCHICYDESDLNIRVAPDYYFAKDVPGPGILATGLYLTWAVGKPPDFVLEMASPAKAREDLTVKRKLYQELGIAEYWRLDPTGGDLYGAPIAGDRLNGDVYEPIPPPQAGEGQRVGPQRGNGDRPVLDERDLRVPGA